MTNLILGLALVADTVGEDKLGMTMAWISITMNIGLMLGPLLGGIAYDKIGWYRTFALGFGVLGLDILLRTIVIEKHVANRYRTIIIEEVNQEKGHEDPQCGRKSRTPEIIRLLRYPRMIAAVWVILTQATITASFDSSLPLHLNRLFGWTSFQAGI